MFINNFYLIWKTAPNRKTTAFIYFYTHKISINPVRPTFPMNHIPLISNRFVQVYLQFDQPNEKKNGGKNLKQSLDNKVNKFFLFLGKKNVSLSVHNNLKLKSKDSLIPAIKAPKTFFYLLYFHSHLALLIMAVCAKSTLCPNYS